MAWLNQHDKFETHWYQAPILGIAAEMGRHDSGFHSHNMGQLLFTQQGCILISLENRLSLLPPGRVAWIPANIVHRAQMRASVGYRSVYLNQQIAHQVGDEVMILTVTALLRELLERIAVAPFDSNWQQGRLANLLPVFIDELQHASKEPMLLAIPQDRRMKNLNMEQLPPPLMELAKTIGASEKTITRLFLHETGMSYQAWRQQWRFIKAVELLAQGKTYSFITQELGLSSDSAFISFFRKMSGVTPKEYQHLADKK
ncbi:helix-turn-helix domain-containing protein [Providencia vermicola]|uniref:Helix-turn-helix transcriptional regulator n=2 Tax=Providencia TaxID=586 RepID=A0AAI9I0S4_PROST|nr:MULTISPECIES: helix-turn-helix transcriptional regulator [Providencia]ELR5045386.1 helix-turn-helix transcriptional regulator [Providencia rettgeri]ELR5036154.1 helix-turn-helix transcriptional regulator [Providencia stuartii]ELR5120776.1 helix-turn-helix transcriptional regulator [Providencia stuartii]ELR5144315.1 helix-turn-helix transcriptional regulator [Providencia stuartii]ELR5293363.1 helix-turn-helix transcriptional regulator [Providencia stuartii]